MKSLEILISTMHQNQLNIAETVQIQTDTLLINQTDTPMNLDRSIWENRVRMRSFSERGISRSRNRALDFSEGEICHIADDDFQCHTDYKKRILQAYKENPNADIIVFPVLNLDKERDKVFSKSRKQVGFLRSMKVTSSEITFNRKRVLESGVRFRENFGVGSGKFTLGEENIFLFECLRQGLKIMYVPDKIGLTGTRESTWYTGLNEHYLYSRGASFAAMSERYAWLMILQYAARKHKQYKKNMSFFKAHHLMRKGMQEYLTDCEEAMSMKKRILVTGGAGLIGSNLAKRLLEEGHEVTVMDNFYSSAETNLEELKSYEAFHFVHHDVTQPFFEDVDEIYHLACPASPIYYQKDPVYTIKTAFYGSLNALENAKQKGAKVLLASTSEIYGDPLEHPQKETYWGNVHPNGPRSCYDEGKRSAETLFSDYHREYHVDTRIARIFNTYGEGMHQNDGRVVSNFVMQALRAEPITVYGDGEQTRSFCYVSDTVDGLIRLMQHEGHALPVNVGNPHEVTIRELAESIAEKVDKGSGIVFKLLPTDDPVRRCPDIAKAKSLLGWEPKVSFDEGMDQTIAYFKMQIQEKL
jgi:UDP-glucuronate decarboxylase